MVAIAAVIAGLALLDAVVGLAERFQSARLGEGLIVDLRSRVFDHVQRMPIAFFTRTHTGALVSRLNNDVIGAQRLHLRPVGCGHQPHRAGADPGRDVRALVADHQLSLVLLPVFVIPARRVELARRPAAARGGRPQRGDDITDDRALLGPPVRRW